jgi:hypothetical protein
MLAQQPRPDRVKRSRPRERVGHDASIRPQHLRRDALDPPLHLGSRAAREGQQHNTARIGTAHDEVADAVRQRIDLAGTGPSNNEEGRNLIERIAAVLDGAALFGGF